MKSVNALQLRQSLGKVVASLLRTGEPILLEKGGKPVAVLITLQDFRERFVEKDALLERQRIMSEIDTLAMQSVDRTPGGEVVRQLRSDG